MASLTASYCVFQALLSLVPASYLRKRIAVSCCSFDHEPGLIIGLLEVLERLLQCTQCRSILALLGKQRAQTAGIDGYSVLVATVSPNLIGFEVLIHGRVILAQVDISLSQVMQ